MPFYRNESDMIDQVVLEDARRLMTAGADVELILIFLRSRGFDQIDSVTAIRTLTGVSRDDAKKLVCGSKAWADRFNSVQELHDKARKALLELAATGDKDLPKIELAGFEETES